MTWPGHLKNGWLDEAKVAGSPKPAPLIFRYCQNSPLPKFDFHLPVQYRIYRPKCGSREVPMFEGLFQPTHLIIIFAIALLVFGPKKLPELGKGLGEGIRALKEGMKDNPSTPADTKSTDSKETKV